MNLEIIQEKKEIISLIGDITYEYFHELYLRITTSQRLQQPLTFEQVLISLDEDYNRGGPLQGNLRNFEGITGFVVPFIHFVGRQPLKSLPSERKERISKNCIHLVFRNYHLQEAIGGHFGAQFKEAFLLEWGIFLSEWPKGIELAIHYTGDIDLIALDLHDLYILRDIFHEWRAKNPIMKQHRLSGQDAPF